MSKRTVLHTDISYLLGPNILLWSSQFALSETFDIPKSE
jgi:hypothetical protein